MNDEILELLIQYKQRKTELEIYSQWPLPGYLRIRYELDALARTIADKLTEDI